MSKLTELLEAMGWVGEDEEERKRDAAALLKQIQDTLDDPRGGVMVSTYTKAWEFRHQHRGMFKLSKDGTSVLMQRGKHWDDIMYARVRFGRMP